jgi:hypothetical protein
VAFTGLHANDALGRPSNQMDLDGLRAMPPELS